MMREGVGGGIVTFGRGDALVHGALDVLARINVRSYDRLDAIG